MSPSMPYQKVRLLPAYTDWRGSVERHKTSPPTPERPFIVSASSLRDFMRCRLKWHWRHQARLVPKRDPVNLAIGSLGHEMLEAWYKLPFKARTPKAMKLIAQRRLKQTTPDSLSRDDLELVKAMVIGYAGWARERDKEAGLTDGVRAEEWFTLPLNEERTILVNGKIDLLRPMKKKLVTGREFKLKSRIDISNVELMLQLTVYLWAMWRLYPEATDYEVYYTILRKQAPGPRVTADLFHQEPVTRDVADLKQWQVDAERCALDMLGAAIYPNPQDSCSWDCDYQLPCLLRATPRDLRDALKRDYVAKEARS